LVALLLTTVVAQAQTLTILHSFSGNGASPQAGVIRDAVGNLYGTTFYGGGGNCDGNSPCGLVFKLTETDDYTVLHAFAGYPNDGGNPEAAVVRDSAGNLYGTTSEGGTSGYGIVFKLDTQGKLTVLHAFAGVDGEYPSAGLVRDEAGNLYGTTTKGGSSNHGTVFKLSATGKETVLHSFHGYPKDGSDPIAGLVLDNSGNLYGTTYSGGASHYGTVFKLDKVAKETVLYSFTGGDGAYPTAGLVLDEAGNLYGTTSIGGTGTCNDDLGCGTVFKLDKSRVETVLYSFPGQDGSAELPGGLLRDAAGNLFGVTFYGGGSACGQGAGCGTVFKLDTTGTETDLHSFAGGPTDGLYPAGTLIMDKSGNLYGTTEDGGGGNCRCGTVWKLTP